jgi:hypothetical protein
MTTTAAATRSNLQQHRFIAAEDMEFSGVAGSPNS